MYYPKQIPYLLNKEFQENIEYKEYQIKELNTVCMCFWQMKSKQVQEKIIYNYILPDACIDLVIDFTNQTICFAGFSKETIPFVLKNKIDYLGVRLKPGVFYYLYQIPALKVMDKQVPFENIEKSKLLSSLLKETNEEKRRNILINYWFKKIKGKSLPFYIQEVEIIYNSPLEKSILMLKQKFQCKERQLQRKCKTVYGVSPKTLLNIIRLHLCLTLLLEKKNTLIEIANVCGFYDQSHFIKEIKKFTGYSPLKIMEKEA